jgi:hypothetical protein
LGRHLVGRCNIRATSGPGVEGGRVWSPSLMASETADLPDRARDCDSHSLAAGQKCLA